jgi:putative ABC transport system permease protein
MLRNYLKIAIRNLLHQKLYSFITIFGLAFGMACFLMISSYIRFENSYDNFQKNGKDTYRLDKAIHSNGNTFYRSLTGASTAPLLQDQFPSIKNTVRFCNLLFCLVNENEIAFREKRFFFTDSSIFSTFTFPLRSGDPKTALSNPFTVVITPETARKYFGNQDPLGKTIYFQTKSRPGKFAFIVTGVTEEIPSNSTIKFDFLASFSSLGKILGNNFMTNSWDGPVWTYVQLQRGIDPQKVEDLFPSFASKFIPKGEFNATDFRLVLLKDTYYNKGDGIPLGDWGIKFISYLLLFVSFLILLIASINYTSLLSARAITRVKEIGVRKVQGATRLQLFIQFLGESILVSIVSFIFSIAIVELLLPSFQALLREAFPTFGILAEREANFQIFYPSLLAIMLGVALLVGILSGIYPSFILSRYNTSNVLKGEFRTGKSSAIIRKVFVVSQFTFATVFIIVSLHILLQLHTWNNANLGFDKNDLITIPVYDNSLKDKYELFKNRLMQNSDILGVTSSNLIPGGEDSNILSLRSGKVNDLTVVTYFVNQDFVKTLGLKIIGGRDFDKANAADQNSAILMNKAAMNACGWDNVNGQAIDLYLKQDDKVKVLYTGNLVGEIDNFRYRFFKPTDDPLIIKINPNVMQYILIKADRSNFSNALNEIKSVWKELNIPQSFSYSYLTDDLTESYSMYNALYTFIRFASLIAILIAVLGLFALASFIIDRKTKEIGIRKVMGATTNNIIYRLTKSFILLVIIAIIIGLPVSYKLTDYLLQNLPMHIEINLWLFVAGAIFVIILSSAVVGIKSLAAANNNPAQSLRYE